MSDIDYIVSNDRPLSNITFITDNLDYREYAQSKGYNFLYIDLDKLKDMSNMVSVSRYIRIFDEYCDRYIVCVKDDETKYAILKLVASSVTYINPIEIISSRNVNQKSERTK